MNVILTLLYYTVKMSTPLLFVIMGGVFVQRAGVFNFALESAINTGAFAAIAVIMVTNNLLAGIIGALLACVLVNMFFALFTVKINAHPTVVGMAINLLTAAIIPYLMMALFETSAVLNVTQVVDPASVPIDVPILRKIPILGDIFNKQSPLTYLSFLAVAVLTLIYYKTDFGTHVRLVGDSREAAEAIGINVNKIKVLALVISGICCALAGLNISVESLGMYTLNLSASRGYICRLRSALWICQSAADHSGKLSRYDARLASGGTAIYHHNCCPGYDGDSQCPPKSDENFCEIRRRL